MKLVFYGGSAYGPNGRFGAWQVSVDDTWVVTIAGQVLDRDIKAGPEPLQEAERAALDTWLGQAATADGPSERNGIPGEARFSFEIETPAGRREMSLWMREALKRPPLAGLLRWIDDLIQARTGHFAAFGR